MLRILGRVFQFQILFLGVWLGCYWVAGPQKAPFWFALIGVTLLALTVVGLVFCFFETGTG